MELMREIRVYDRHASLCKSDLQFVIIMFILVTINSVVVLSTFD
jgi:hypothetical protein